MKRIVLSALSTCCFARSTRPEPKQSGNPSGRRRKTAIETLSDLKIPKSWLKIIEKQRGKNALPMDFFGRTPAVAEVVETRLILKACLGDHRSIVEVLNRRYGKPKSEHVSVHGSLRVDASLEMQNELEGVHERLAKLLTPHDESSQTHSLSERPVIAESTDHT